MLRDRAIPDPLWLDTLSRYPFLGWRTTADLMELRRLSTLFLARKEFTGVAGFEVTDAIAVAVAAQACVPALRWGVQAYDRFVGIVMHADEVLAPREVTDADGVVHAYDEPLTGEAMAGGPVMLSWRDVAGAGESAAWGYNVVIHEFAHVLDMADGVADGIPPMATCDLRSTWTAVIGRGLQELREAIEQNQRTWLDDYAAQSMEEYFAVASETFFVAPRDLLEGHPPVYRLLAGFYGQDPARFAY